MDFTLQLDESANRPIIKLDSLFEGCTALLDTGAILPLWTKSVELLEGLGGKLVKKDVSFSGFGGKVKGDLYSITLQLGSILYPNMYLIAYNDESLPGFFLFSATMFQDMSFTVNNKAHSITIMPGNQVCYHLKIEDSGGNLHVLINSE